MGQILTALARPRLNGLRALPAKQFVRSNPDYPLAYRWLAAALGQLGRTAEAKEALEKAIASGPASFDWYVPRYTQPSWTFRRHGIG